MILIFIVEKTGKVIYNVKDIDPKRCSMKKKLTSFFAVVIISALIIGCGSNTDNGKAGLTFQKDGSVIHTIVEEFAESYYNLDEFKASVEEQIEVYNNTVDENRIQLNSADVSDGVIKVEMCFVKPSAYTGFYKKALFCGTIREAVNAGYDLDITLSSAENSDVKIGKTQILEMSDRHIIVVREAVPIRPYAEILYISGDVEVSEDRKEAIPGNSENLSYIIFK